jgi:hypothetical protein
MSWPRLTVDFRRRFAGSVSFFVSLTFHLVVLLMMALVILDELSPSRSILEVLAVEEPLPLNAELAHFQLTELSDVFPYAADETAFDVQLVPVAGEAAVEMPQIELMDLEGISVRPAILDIGRLADLWREIPDLDRDNGEDTMEDRLVLDMLNSRLRREKAQTGDIQISLMWNNVNDLDLHVICPCGDKICYLYRRSACGGELDVDMNARGGTHFSPEPVENIFWPHGGAAPGNYVVIVDHYSINFARDPTSYRGVVRIDGEVVRVFSGKIRYGQPARIVHRFAYVGAHPKMRATRMPSRQNPRGPTGP